MKRLFLFALATATIGFAACTKCDTPGHGGRNYPENGNGIAPGGCIPPLECEGVICTAQFADVQLEVRNSAGAAVQLDSFVVTDLGGTPLPAGSAGPVYGYPNASDGRYSVINDSWLQGHQNSSKQVVAKGFMNGAQVFSEPFTIFADCCHVGKNSGKDVVSIP